jgi:hypothetical protein
MQSGFTHSSTYFSTRKLTGVPDMNHLSRLITNACHSYQDANNHIFYVLALQ